MRPASDTNVWGAVRWTEGGRYEVIFFTNSRESAQQAAARHDDAFVIFRGTPRQHDDEKETLW